MAKTTKTKSKYKQLCEAYDFGIKECNNYCKECRDFVQELKNNILDYLGCHETKLFMYPPSTGFIYNNQTLQGDSLDTEFGENGQAAIGFALNVNGNDLEEKFVTFIIVFKKIDNKISFSVDDEKDFWNTHEGIEKFCDYLFEVANDNLKNRLQNFLKSPESANKPIGFKPGKN